MTLPTATTPARIMFTRPVQECLRKVGGDIWSIGGKHHLIRRKCPGDRTWSDGGTSFYGITETPQTDQAQASTSQSDFPIIYEVGKNSAHVIWKIGNAFLKLVIPHTPMATREHNTLDFVKTLLPSSVVIPQVLCHGEWDGRYYILVTQVPGLTLHDAWPHMSPGLKNKCIRQVTEVCSQLAKNTGKRICGIDGGHLQEFFLLKGGYDFSPSMLESNSRDIGMDCTRLCLYHCDLTPGNVLVDLTTGTVGLIDWECAGFVPREWIRTKFCVCGAMDLETTTVDEEEKTDRKAWWSQMDASLEEAGFSTVATAWMEWHTAN